MKQSKERFVNVKKEEVKIQEGSTFFEYVPVDCITKATHARNKSWANGNGSVDRIYDYSVSKDSLKIYLNPVQSNFVYPYTETELSDWEFFKKEELTQEPIIQTKYIIEMDEDSAVVLRDILGSFKK